MLERLVFSRSDGVPNPGTENSPALYRDEDKLHTYRGSQASKSGIDIYSCAGKLIRRINVGDACSQVGAPHMAVTDVYSGTKAQYVD